MKDQKNEKREFKKVMKNFSFDYSEEKPLKDLTEFSKNKKYSPLSLKRGIISTDRGRSDSKENTL